VKVGARERLCFTFTMSYVVVVMRFIFFDVVYVRRNK